MPKLEQSVRSDTCFRVVAFPGMHTALIIILIIIIIILLDLRARSRRPESKARAVAGGGKEWH